MNYEELAKSDIEAGQRRQERYEYYLVALVFTTLAFSIQTATNTGVAIVSIFEITAWLSLFASGLFALSRMYYLPVIYAYSAEVNALSANIQDAKELEKQGHSELVNGNGETGTIHEYISNHKKAIDSRESKSKKIERKIKRFSVAHRILFVIGFSALIASRSYSHFVGVLC